MKRKLKSYDECKQIARKCRDNGNKCIGMPSSEIWKDYKTLDDLMAKKEFSEIKECGAICYYDSKWWLCDDWFTIYVIDDIDEKYFKI